MNYRGYGGSDCHPAEKALFRDSEIVFDAVSGRHKTVSLIGRSLGSGVACWLASQRPVDRMVLVTPYDSILNIASAAYPVFPVRYLLKDQYRSSEYATGIDVPVLAVLAENDGVIPADSSNRLVEAFAGDVEVEVLPGTGHNDLQGHSRFYSLIGGFLGGG